MGAVRDDCFPVCCLECFAGLDILKSKAHFYFYALCHL